MSSIVIKNNQFESAGTPSISWGHGSVNYFSDPETLTISQNTFLVDESTGIQVYFPSFIIKLIWVQVQNIAYDNGGFIINNNNFSMQYPNTSSASAVSFSIQSSTVGISVEMGSNIISGGSATICVLFYFPGSLVYTNNTVK